jgi:chromosome segregation ATPase
MPLKRATESASRAGGAIERFIERTLAPRLEELTGEVRGLRGEMQQIDKRLTESIGSLRNEMQSEIRSVRGEMQSLRSEMQTELRSVRTEIEATRMQVNTRIDALSQRLDDALDIRERLVAVEAKLAARGN